MDWRLFRRFDYILFLATFFAVLYGLAMIASATLGVKEPNAPLWDDLVFRQAVYATIGLVVLFAAAIVDYRLWGRIARLLYVGMLVLLVLVLGIGQVGGGTRGWFRIGAFVVQPSQLAWLLAILSLARYMADHDMRQMRHVLISLALAAVPMTLIYLQPDLGTALIVGVAWLGMAYMAGIRLWHLGLLGLAGALSIPWVLDALEGYMRDRIILFLDPERDPLGIGYNLTQSLIAIGSGGLWGRGWGSGTQSQLHFLRVRHTDYIFSVIGEELGFLGAMLLFTLLIVVIWRCLRNAGRARDPFGRLIATGIGIAIFFQAAVNIAVNLGMLPTTGIPLPLISYGGSVLLVILTGLGLVESVAMRQKRTEF